MDRRTDLAHLSEGQVVDGVDLSRAEAAALNATRLVTVQPGPDGWRVTAAYAVGAVQCGSLTIRVHPKIGHVQVLRLLARAHGMAGLNLDASLIGAGAEPDLITVMAALFADEATTALAAGPLRGYRTEDRSLNVLRGRLRIREQQLRRYGQLMPLEVTVDEWTTDTDDNRRIRTAGRRLLMLPGLPRLVQERLAHLDRVLADVRVMRHGDRLAPWTPTRLNARLHRLLHLADLVLDHSSVEHCAGDIEVHGFMVSMAWLFEKLVARLLAEAGDDVHVSAQQPFGLDDGDRLRIKPDLVFSVCGQVIAVADTKYKLLDDTGRFPNADAYQLVTYCGRLGLSTGHLIYAAGDPCPEPYEILGTGARLVVHAVDMTRPLTDIERSVEELLAVIAGLAALDGVGLDGWAIA